MLILWLLPGIALPTLVGWFLLELLEGKTRVLSSGEQWVLGFVLGLTFSMFCAFLANVFLGVPLTLGGFLVLFSLLLAALGIPWLRRQRSQTRAPRVMVFPPSPRPPRGATIALIILSGWVGLRLITLGVLAFLTPPFFDDTMDNWNFRGKLFFFQRTFTLAFPWDSAPGVSSYPPTVPLVKTWLSTLAGTWNDPLVNSVHVLWLLALLLLLFWTLRRTVPLSWALLGTIILASLPLELIQGTNAYADVFLSVHVFAAVTLLFHALRETTRERALSWLRLSGMAIALVPFTKNEGWALYFPVLLLLLLGSLLWLQRRGVVARRQTLHTGLFALFLSGCVAAPWIGFKVLSGLAFGNAKALDWQFQWRPGVLLAIIVNTFFEGNWGLLFPLFFGLLLIRFRAAFRAPLLLLTACFLIPYTSQLVLYLMTGLAQEALFQTGYARGLIHLMPVIVSLTTLLLHDLTYGRPGTAQT